MEEETFFNELSDRYRRKSIEEQIIEHAEEEFNGFSKEQQSRQEERKQLKDDIKTLRKKIKTLKNTKNTRRGNTGKASKRNVLKKEIAKLQVRLQEIDAEEM